VSLVAESHLCKTPMAFGEAERREGASGEGAREGRSRDGAGEGDEHCDVAVVDLTSFC
jgi:hypothetical protein